MMKSKDGLKEDVRMKMKNQVSDPERRTLSTMNRKKVLKKL